MGNMKRLLSVLLLLLLFAAPVFAVDVAPRISDREIVERLTRLEEGQKAIQQRFDDVNKRFDDVNKRFDDVNKRFDDVNKRFDTLQWMFGIFITAALFIMGFIVKILWTQRKQLAEMEVSLETQKDELTFLKTLIEKLLPPKGVL